MTAYAGRAPIRDSSRTDEVARIVRTGGALLSLQAVTWTTTLVGIIVVPRFLGASNFGILSTAMTVSALGSLFASWGTTNQVLKNVARDRRSARDWVVHAIALRLMIWLPLLVISATFAWSIGSERAGLVFVLVMAGATLSLVTEVILAALQGAHVIGRAAAVSTAISLASHVAIAIFLLLGGGLLAMTGITAVAALVTLVTVVSVFVRELPGHLSPSSRTLRALGAGGLAFLAWDIGLRVFGTADILLLAAFTSTGEVGVYAFAYRLAGIPIFAATVVTMSVFPTLAATWEADPQWFRSVLNQAIRWVTLITIPMAAGLALLAGDLTALLSGGRFEGAGLLVAIVSLHIPLAAVHTVMGMGLVARDRQRYMATVAWMAAAFNITANLLAIPLADAVWGRGAIGSAVVTVATEVLVGAWVWKECWRTIERTTLDRIARAVLAAVGMLVVLIVSREIVSATVVLIPVGALVYAGFALALGVVTVEDVGRVTVTLYGRPHSTGAPPPPPVVNSPQQGGPEGFLHGTWTHGPVINFPAPFTPRQLKPQRLNAGSTPVDDTAVVRSVPRRVLKRQKSALGPQEVSHAGIADVE